MTETVTAGTTATATAPAAERAAGAAQPGGPPGADGIFEALESAIAAAVAPGAAGTDREGRFPADAVRALAGAGVLGLLSAPEVGGPGAGLREAAAVVERLAGVCGSTAMVVLMHYAATAVIEAHGPGEVRRAVAEGRHLSTLAFSEAGSRSHFWAPLGTAVEDGDRVRLDARKSWVTSAGEADSQVWSSRPLAGSGPMTLWLVPADRPGLRVNGPFDGLGLRGNASSPVTAKGVTVAPGDMLGADGAGLDIAFATALPRFLVLSAAFSLGVMEAMTGQAAGHLTATRLDHLDTTLAGQPLPRAAFARLRIATDGVRAFLADTLDALEAGRDDSMLRVLQVKALAGEAAAEVGDGVMRLCGGSALRRDKSLERHFRDGLAARVMAPTTEALHDFCARVSLGLPLLEGG